MGLPHHALALPCPPCHAMPCLQVFTAGGDVSNDRQAELYSPPYLFKGPRPVINSVQQLIKASGGGRQGVQQRQWGPACKLISGLRKLVSAGRPSSVSSPASTWDAGYTSPHPAHPALAPDPLAHLPGGLRRPPPLPPLQPGDTLEVAYNSTDPVTKAILIRTGAITHSMNFGARCCGVPAAPACACCARCARCTCCAGAGAADRRTPATASCLLLPPPPPCP